VRRAGPDDLEAVVALCLEEVRYGAQVGGGVAAQILRHVHDAMDTAGIAVTLLHYGALNPLSGPLWHRSGYRPLRTRWTLRIAR